MTVPTRLQLVPVCPALVGCARAGWSRGWALSSFPGCVAFPCGSSSRAGVGMLVPGAVCSAPSVPEQMPAVFRAVSHALFTSTKIQIRLYQGELHASIARLIKSFTLCSWGMCLVIYFRLRDNWFFFSFLSALVQAGCKLPKPSATRRVSPDHFLCWQRADFCWALIKFCSWGLASFTPFYSMSWQFWFLQRCPMSQGCTCFALGCLQPLNWCIQTAWGLPGGKVVVLAAVPQGLASAFIQAPALPGLKTNLRKEEKQEWWPCAAFGALQAPWAR